MVNAFLSGEGALNIPGVVEDIFTIASKALSFVTTNPLLLVFFAAPIVGIGIGVIKRLKG